MHKAVYNLAAHQQVPTAPPPTTMIITGDRFIQPLSLSFWSNTKRASDFIERKYILLHAFFSGKKHDVLTFLRQNTFQNPAFGLMIINAPVNIIIDIVSTEVLLLSGAAVFSNINSIFTHASSVVEISVKLIMTKQLKSHWLNCNHMCSTYIGQTKLNATRKRSRALKFNIQVHTRLVLALRNTSVSNADAW